MLMNNIQVLALAQLQMTSLVITVIVVGAFLAAVALNFVAVKRIRGALRTTVRQKQIMRYALEMGNINVIRCVMGLSRVENQQGGLLPDEGVGLQDYISHIHPEDRDMFSHMVTRISLRQQGSAEWTYRWNAAAEQGETEWRSLHCNAIAEGQSLPMDVVCTLTDETKAVNERTQEQEMAGRYRLIFERSVVGLGFYDKDGMMLAANSNLREIFNIQPGNDPMFFNVSIFRRPPFRDIINLDDLYETHLCTRIIMPERRLDKFLDLQITPTFDDTGQLQYLLVAARDVTEEREIYKQSQETDRQMRKANEEIRRYEKELQYLMDEVDMRVWRVSFETGEVNIYRNLGEPERKMTLMELKDYFVERHDIVSEKFKNPELYFRESSSYICHMRSLFHDTDQLQWNVIDNIPLLNEEGRLVGSFGTIRNITSLMEVQDRLKEETQRANDSARLKSVFMANMTHEIRTPLNAIVGFSDVLTMMDSPEDKREMIRVIMNNCDMLLRLINDILEVSGMDTNAIKLEPTDVDFAVSFNDICETLRQRVQEPGVEFIKDNPYTEFLTRIDVRRVQQVITNFVTNAVKYTHQGHIRVGYRYEKGGLYVYCEDTGAGIPKEQQSSVFERFVKLNDYVQGTGLGLSICKAIALRAGGRIGVESEGEGTGSTFWLWIPCDHKKKENA
ncbi:MAG: hypothetical protein J1E77_03925 [Prevotella sp.]|nr:hypothetical protein [Prevotella sp.]